MDLLKKVKSASLIEAIIATLLIVIIFIISSLVINNLLLNNFSNNTHEVENRLNELEYKLITHQITIPYQETYNEWDITIGKEADEKNRSWIKLDAIHEGSNKQIVRKRNHASK